MKNSCINLLEDQFMSHEKKKEKISSFLALVADANETSFNSIDCKLWSYSFKSKIYSSP